MVEQQHKIYPKYETPWNPRSYGGNHLFIYITPIIENLPQVLEDWRNQIILAINECAYEPHIKQGSKQPLAEQVKDKGFGCIWADDFSKVRNYSPTHTKVIEYWFHYEPEDIPKLDYVRNYWKWYQLNAGKRNIPNEYPVRVRQDIWLHTLEGEPDPRANSTSEEQRKKKKIM